MGERYANVLHGDVDKYQKNKPGQTVGENNSLWHGLKVLSDCEHKCSCITH